MTNHLSLTVGQVVRIYIMEVLEYEILGYMECVCSSWDMESDFYFQLCIGNKTGSYQGLESSFE